MRSAAVFRPLSQTPSRSPADALHRSARSTRPRSHHRPTSPRRTRPRRPASPVSPNRNPKPTSPGGVIPRPGTTPTPGATTTAAPADSGGAVEDALRRVPVLRLPLRPSVPTRSAAGSRAARAFPRRPGWSRSRPSSPPGWPRRQAWPRAVVHGVPHRCREVPLESIPLRPGRAPARTGGVHLDRPLGCFADQAGNAVSDERRAAALRHRGASRRRDRRRALQLARRSPRTAGRARERRRARHRHRMERGVPARRRRRSRDHRLVLEHALARRQRSRAPAGDPLLGDRRRRRPRDRTRVPGSVPDGPLGCGSLRASSRLRHARCSPRSSRSRRRT